MVNDGQPSQLTDQDEITVTFTERSTTAVATDGTSTATVTEEDMITPSEESELASALRSTNLPRTSHISVSTSVGTTREAQVVSLPKCFLIMMYIKSS